MGRAKGILLIILAIDDFFRFSSSGRKKENHSCTEVNSIQQKTTEPKVAGSL